MQPRQLLLPRHRRHPRRLIPLTLAQLRKRRRKLVTSTTTATRIKPAISKAALPRVDGKVRRRLLTKQVALTSIAARLERRRPCCGGYHFVSSWCSGTLLFSGG